ncbi:MAG: GntR family transcriptional regulator [Intestinibacter bartlettii]|uniref:GntR family transcriptional regulator n=1 Tax=Intestinibacter bartlettii TaxID=261299 RepID=UPI0026EFDE46|nr:GntR family transcriptional regulator [Intestinibacter bartlettii]MDO5009589.1 GntR family transcriptional regulator [Intestinibacter bartlettii]
MKGIDMIDKNSPLPLYFQLQNSLLEKIKDGTYPKNKALPTEYELTEQYGVSRITVRQAIDNLVKEGYIEKRRGVGTFVVEREKLNSWDLGSLKSFEEAFKESNHEIRTEMISIKCIKLNNKLQNIFDSKEKEVYQLKRVRFIDERPAMYITTYVPASIFPQIDKYDFSSVSLYKTMSDEYKINISYAEKEFRVIAATKDESEKLKLKIGSPLQEVKTITYDDKNRIIEYSISRDSGDISTYKIKLKYRSK